MRSPQHCAGHECWSTAAAHTDRLQVFGLTCMAHNNTSCLTTAGHQHHHNKKRPHKSHVPTLPILSKVDGRNDEMYSRVPSLTSVSGGCSTHTTGTGARSGFMLLLEGAGIAAGQRTCCRAQAAAQSSASHTSMPLAHGLGLMVAQCTCRNAPRRRHQWHTKSPHRNETVKYNSIQWNASFSTSLHQPRPAPPLVLNKNQAVPDRPHQPLAVNPPTGYTKLGKVVELGLRSLNPSLTMPSESATSLRVSLRTTSRPSCSAASSARCARTTAVCCDAACAPRTGHMRCTHVAHVE